MFNTEFDEENQSIVGDIEWTQVDANVYHKFVVQNGIRDDIERFKWNYPGPFDNEFIAYVTRAQRTPGKVSFIAVASETTEYGTMYVADTPSFWIGYAKLRNHMEQDRAG